MQTTSPIKIRSVTPESTTTSEPSGLTKAEQNRLDEARRRSRMLETVAALERQGKTKKEAARLCGESETTIWRWRKAFDKSGAKGLLPGTESCGRKSPLDAYRRQLNRWLLGEHCGHAEVQRRLLDRFGLRIGLPAIDRFHTQITTDRNRLAELVGKQTQVVLHIVLERSGEVLAAQRLTIPGLPIQLEVSRP